jgi:hypothetical protein
MIPLSVLGVTAPIARALLPKVLAGLAVVLLAVGLHAHGYIRGKAAEHAERIAERAELQQAVITHQTQVRETEREAQESINEISTRFSAAEAERLAALAAATTDHDRMRDDLVRARRRAAAAAAGPEVDAARLARAFDECTSESVRIQDGLGAEILRLAGVADDYAGRVIGLQAYALAAQAATQGGP